VKRKLILVVLFVFLFVFISLAIVFSISQKKCTELPNNYPFLQEFSEKESTLHDITYETKGLIYNSSIDEDTQILRFDINTFSGNNYIANIELPIDKISTDIKPFSETSVSPAVITINFNRDSFLDSFHINSYSIDKITFSKEAILNMLEKIYTGISESNKVKSPNTFENYNLPYSKIYITQEDNISFFTVGYDRTSLLKPLLMSLIYDSKAELRNKISEKYTIDSASLLTYLDELSTFKTSQLDPKAKELGSDTTTIKQIPFACTIVEKILSSSLANDSVRDKLTREYCNLESFREQIALLNPSNGDYEYTMNDLMYLLNVNNMKNSNVSKENSDLISNHIGILKDISAIEEIYNKTLFDQQTKDDLSSSLATIIASTNQINADNSCKIIYASEKDSDLYNGGKRMFLYSNMSDVLKIIDENPDSILWCMNTYKEDKDFNSFLSSILTKFYFLNMKTEFDVYGFWNKNVYSLEANSILFNILLSMYESA